MFSSASGNFSNKSNLNDSGISLLAAPCRTNLKLHNIYVTSKLVKKVINNIDMSEPSDLDCILMVVLKNYEPKFSYILAELFNVFHRELSFPNCWKISSVLYAFENVWERFAAKNYYPSFCGARKIMLLFQQ